MKILFDRDLEVVIPEKGRSSIVSTTPQYRFLNSSHLRDLQNELGCVKSVILTLLDDPPDRVFDLMAGCGFTAKLFQKYFPQAEIIVNDLDGVCCEVLRESFPTVLNEDVNKLWLNYTRNDLVFIDFNTFTLKKYETFSKVLERVVDSGAKLLLTDSAVFGFRFGSKNFKTYGVKDSEGYYELLEQVVGRGKLFLNCVSSFPNAAVCFFDRFRKSREYLPGLGIPFNVFRGGGFFK